MSQLVKQPKWKVVEYSRSQIINAGKTIRQENSSAEEVKHAIDIIDNWRAAHAFPLHVIYIHLRRMCENDKDVVVAERLKRLDSIVAKLKREQSMNLWTMQDLGGCRVIVPSVQTVYDYFEKYDKSRKRHITSAALNHRVIVVYTQCMSTTATKMIHTTKTCLLKSNSERIYNIFGQLQWKQWGSLQRRVSNPALDQKM